MHFMVNFVKDNLQSELVSSLYKADQIESLLSESWGWSWGWGSRRGAWWPPGGSRRGPGGSWGRSNTLTLLLLLLLLLPGPVWSRDLSDGQALPGLLGQLVILEQLREQFHALGQNLI